MLIKTERYPFPCPLDFLRPWEGFEFCPCPCFVRLGRDSFLIEIPLTFPI